MKQVYVLVSKTATVTSKLVHTFTHGTYTPASLAITPETDKFYSYARRRLYNFLVGGIINEDIHTFVFARFPDCNCALFEIDVSDEDYDRIKAQIDLCLDNYDKATYSFLGAALMRNRAFQGGVRHHNNGVRHQKTHGPLRKASAHHRCTPRRNSAGSRLCRRRILLSHLQTLPWRLPRRLA